MEQMRFGLFGINVGPCAEPETLVAVARAAEAAGFESVWTGEHVVLPDPQVPPSPLPPRAAMLDPAIALTFAAAHTRHLKLGTGIIILPQRNPLVLAKELASLDVVSGGRLVFGIGVGYLRAEFDALNVPFASKGARTEEYLRAILSIWCDDEPRLAGRFFAYSGVQAYPRPVQRPHPPIVFGGHTPAAFARAARLARGWYGFALTPEATATAIDGLRAACRDAGRDFADLEISVTPTLGPGVPTPDLVARYASLGVHRLIVYPVVARDAAAVLDHVEQVGRTLIARA